MSDDPTNAELLKKIEILEESLDEMQENLIRFSKWRMLAEEMAQKSTFTVMHLLIEWCSYNGRSKTAI